ncbi:DUF1365 domain-containing protein [Brevundimonas sp. Root1279]|uniref:DUF1365 domain-containing protein n=1 Tax=Brevundimonas sp. Root1279 TaxID=1736443 RepID=UPI0006F41609|nr:DUF1365 family protein [Brevundimonas sp. Root1279]KQW82464.1 hypothetical protein ASC65_09470 [Brevundimonas sp. Root1279]
MTEASALYRGEVRHHRLRPREHRLRYRVFWLLLDLAEIDRLDRRLRLFSRNRFNVLALYDRDHGDRSGGDLRSHVTACLARGGVDIGGGPIRLLTMPRVLGYVFNPISVYYCHLPDGALAAMVYEVANTFGEHHAYVIPIAEADRASGRIRQGAAKALYVSPFLGMDMDYQFRVHAPGGRLDLAILAADDQGPLLTASLAAHRRSLTDRQLALAVAAMPLLTLKVIVAIHWEALKLWLKGVRLTHRPPPGPEAVTVGGAPATDRAD